MSNTAKDQAIAQVESICALIAALGVNYDRLEELQDEEKEWGDEDAQDWSLRHNLPFPGGEELAELEDAAGDCTDADEALQRIHEDPLSVEVRSGWVDAGGTLEPEEFRIVLCTGGPHVELQGELMNGEPSTVRVLYRGWGDSGVLFGFDHAAVLEYCKCFYFGE